MAERDWFQASERLFDDARAFAHLPEQRRLFRQAMGEAYIWHWHHCPEFQAFLRLQGCSAVAPRDPADIPPLLVTVFKEFRLASVAPDEVKIELTSSGTGGRKSAIILDQRSYDRILRIVDAIFADLGMMNRQEKANYLCFSYDPKQAGNVGTSFSDKILTGLTARKSVFYTIRWSARAGDFVFDLDATVDKLLAFARQGLPVRLLGFPAYLWQVCEALRARGLTLDLGPRSFVIIGGGWKVHKDREVSKDDFKKTVAATLGLPAENIRDTFGMVEHGIPYVDCEQGNLHVPIYAQARAVDPETLAPVPHGRPGLLHLMTPYLSSYPSISLLTTDLAEVRDRCPCGRNGEYLRILGRAGLAKHKGCAITALEYLKG